MGSLSMAGRGREGRATLGKAKQGRAGIDNTSIIHTER